MPDLRTNPLSPGDALFLYLEREQAPLSVAAMAEFEGHIPLDLCTRFIESKLPLIPRYRQRVVFPPFDMGLPTWEYDPHFDVTNHVREFTLKRGTETEFKALAGRIMSTNLRRDRPLWDFTLVHGLKGGHTGLVIRIHHCLADGISGVGLMNTILDPSPNIPELPKKKQDFEAPPLKAPSITESLVNGWLNSLERALTVQTDLLEMARQVVASSLRPLAELNHNHDNHQSTEQALASGASLLSDLTRLVPEFGSATDRLPFNVVCQGPQKFNWASISLDEIKAVKNACGTTVNDVVLTVFASAVRRYAELHEMPLARKFLRVIVPVNLRGNGEVKELGNRITFLPVNIPLDIADPRKLLFAVKHAVARSRTARMAELIGLVGTLVETIPTPLQAALLPVLAQLPLSVCNTICTNVPGPQVPLYVLGHKMLSCYPYVPIGGEMGMNCAVLTYNGTAYFGFSGDAQAIPDLKYLDKFLVASFVELRGKTVGKRTAKKAPKSSNVRTPAAKPRTAVPAASTPTADAPQVKAAAPSPKRKKKRVVRKSVPLANAAVATEPPPADIEENPVEEKRDEAAAATAPAA